MMTALLAAPVVSPSTRLTADAIVAVVIVWAIWRQLRPQRFRMQRQIIMPVLLLVISAETIGSVHWTTPALAILGITTAFAFVAGYFRARAVQVDRRPDGSLWVTGGFISVAIYAVTIGLHYGLDALMGQQASATLASTAPIYLAALLLGRVLGLWPKVKAAQAGA